MVKAKVIDWGNPNSGKLVAFIAGAYGAVAAQLALDVSIGTVRGYLHRSSSPMAPAPKAVKFSAVVLRDFCLLQGIEVAGIPAVGGGYVGDPVLGYVGTDDVEEAQSRYAERLASKTLYRPRRGVVIEEPADVPSPVVAESPQEEPEAVVETVEPSIEAPMIVESEAEATLTDVDAERELYITEVDHSRMEPPKESSLAAAIGISSRGPKFARNTPISHRVPEIDQIRDVAVEVRGLEIDVEMPGEDAARRAVLRRKFPNAVNFFKTKIVTENGVSVNMCRTPLWNLAPECLSPSSPKRVWYDDSRRDDSRYVCGNPTSSLDSFTCRECRMQLGEPNRPRTSRFVGKGDSSSRRFAQG